MPYNAKFLQEKFLAIKMLLLVLSIAAESLTGVMRNGNLFK